MNSINRARWAAIGAATAITLGAIGINTTTNVGAITSSGERAVYNPIAPCRLLDTRVDTRIGSEAALGQEETATVAARGAHGNCTATDLPADAVALQLNVTAIGATAPTFLAITPDGARDSSSLNPVPGAPPTPNAVTVALDANGSFAIFNRFGQVDVIVDVAGYYTDHDHTDLHYTKTEVDTLIANNPGPAGPQGPAGPASSLQNVITVSASGGDFTDPVAAVASISGSSASNQFTVLIGPGSYALSSQIVLPPYVHLQGSGRQATTLVGMFAASDFTESAGAAVVADDNVQISDLLIVNTGVSTGGSSTIHADGVRELVIDGVDLLVNNSSGDPSAAVYLANGSMWMDRSSAFNIDTGGGFAVYGVNNGEAVISNSWLQATIGPAPFPNAASIECDFVINEDPYEPGTVLSSDCGN